MKIPNIQELQQIAFNHSSDVDFRDFVNLYKKCTPKSYSFWVIHAPFTSDNPSGFRKNLLERIQKLIMTTNYKISYEKVQNDHRNTAKTSALSSCKIHKYKYLTGKEILLPIKVE